MGTAVWTVNFGGAEDKFFELLLAILTPVLEYWHG
jgi:hypothetical protein